jgi:hypothetical protein
MLTEYNFYCKILKNDDFSLNGLIVSTIYLLDGIYAIIRCDKLIKVYEILGLYSICLKTGKKILTELFEPYIDQIFIIRDDELIKTN